MFVLVIVLICTLMMVCLYTTQHTEMFATTSATASSNPSDQLNLIINPIVSSMNSIIDVFNEVPKNLYQKCTSASKTIGTKLQEYAETMKSYNRSPNDDENLKRGVSVNHDHKSYLDTMRTRKDVLYDVMRREAAAFYAVDFDKQEDELVIILSRLSTYHSAMQPALTKKLAEIQ